MLNFEHITDQNWLTSCQQHIQELLPSILPDVIIDEDSLEPIDDNETEYEGVALYHNRTNILSGTGCSLCRRGSGHQEQIPHPRVILTKMPAQRAFE